MSIISIPKPLREKLGEEATDALTKMLNEQEKETKDSVIDTAELRFEKKVTEEVSLVRTDLAETEKRFDKRLTEGISGVRTEIQKSKTDTIKWMFIFWVGQIGVLLGIIFAVIK